MFTLLFSPGSELCEQTKEVQRLHDDAQNLLIEYDRKFYPGSFARSASLLVVLTKIQQVPESLGRLFFPKLNDIKNLIHHIHTTIINENLKASLR